MPTRYKCPQPGCGAVYETRTQDGYCQDHFDVMLVPVEDTVVPAIARSVPPPQVVIERSDGEPVEGLGLLVCDASVSMDSQVFPGERNDLTRLQLVVGAILSALLDMQTLTLKKRAYIAIIAFGKRAGLIKDRQGKPFILSVHNILEEFGVFSAKQRAAAEGKN